MAKFGNYETSEQIATSGPFTLYRARGGAGGDVALKVYESQAAFIGDLWERKAEQFVQAALVAKTLTDRGARRWNPVFAAERCEEYAFFASALVPSSLPRFISGVRRPSARELGSIIAGIASGLIELRDMMSGRGHGRLNAGAVLLSGGEDGGPGEVLLCDLAANTDAGPQSASEDKVALGKLIFEMVMRREAPNSSGFAMTAEWSSLGAGGKILFELSESLYAGAQCGLTLEQIRDRTMTIPAPSSGTKSIVIGAIAAVLVLAAGGAYFALRDDEQKKKGLFKGQEVLPDKTGACITLTAGATEWTCEIVSKKDCDAKQGRYLGDDKPVARYLADPRELADWPPKLTEEDQNQWRLIERRAYLPESTAKFREMFTAQFDELKADLGRVDDDPRWVPRPEDPAYGDPTLSISLQQKTVDEANRIRGAFESFRSGSEKLKAVAAEIDRLNTGPIKPLVDLVTSILADSEGRLNRLRKEFDAGMMEQVGYDVKSFDFDAVRSELAALQPSDPNAPPPDSQRRNDVVDSAKLLRDRVDELDVSLGSLVSNKIREASNNVGEDLPASLRDAFRNQIEKLAASDLGASEKYARARAATHWSTEVTKAFAIEGLASLDGVFDAAAFERIKGERSARAVAEFVTFVSGLTVFPAIDDASFKQRLEKSSAELGAWRDKTSTLGVRAQRVKTLLERAYLPDEQDNGESIESILRSMRESQEWAELAEAFRPLSELESSMNSIVRDDLAPEQLISVIRDRSLSGVTASTRKRVAWKRLAARGDWPASIDALFEMPKIAAEVRDTLTGAGVNADRLEAISRNEINKPLGDRWLAFVNDRIGAEAASIDRLYSADTRRLFAVAGEVPEGLNEKARFNFDLLKARAEASNLTDSEIPAFISRWESKLSSDERLSRAFALWKAGKFATDWKQAGPGLAGWAVQNEESEDHVVYVKNYKRSTYTLRFNKVDDSSMVSTTEMTIGLVAMLLTEQSATYSRFFARQLDDSGAGVSPWFVDGSNRFALRNPSSNANIPNRGWIPVDARLQVEVGSKLFAEDIAPPKPETPVNFVSASGALALAHSLGCRLPTVQEWKSARTLESQTPNVRDQSFARQQQFASALPISGTLLHLPSAGRFPLEDPARSAVDPKGDVSSNSTNDGNVYFRSVNPGAPEFQDLRGNVAEWTLQGDTRALEVTSAQKLSEDTRSKFAASLAASVGVIGGSAFSPPDIENERFVAASGIPGFSPSSVKFSYSDVGFRLAFTAEGGGGAVGQPSETIRKKLATVPYR